jgi:two-component system chemotaxis response regulator CheY
MYSASASRPQAARNDTPTILVIEDNTPNRLLTSAMLKNARYTCHCAKTIEQGRKVLQDGDVHLVVCDLYFNGSPADTLALLADMRAAPLFAHIPVIIATGDPSDVTRQMVMAAGAAGIIIKPYEEEKLITLVKQCLGEKQA